MSTKMTRNEEILTILGEECAEVIVELSKVKRFGLLENNNRLFKEMADLQCMIDLTRGALINGTEFNFDMAILQKYDKLRRFSNIFEEPVEEPAPTYNEHQRNSIEWFGSPNGA